MITDHVLVRRSILETIEKFPSDALKVYILLLDRAQMQKDLEIGMSLNELARAANLGTLATRHVLYWLANPSYNTFPGDVLEDAQAYIHVKKKGKHYLVQIDSFWAGESYPPIPFTLDDTDQTKIANVEHQLRRLHAQYKRDVLRERSGLADVLRGDTRSLVQEIEGTLGRGLDVPEAFLVGRSVQGWGPDRAKELFRKSATARNPIRAMYAMLRNGVRGVAGQPTERQKEKVVYGEL